MKESFKLLISIAANNGLRLASLDIRTAFLQSKALYRNVFIKPPDDIKMPGFVWRLKKLLYGLDNASRKFWLRLKEILVEMGLSVMDGDEAFHFFLRGGVLQGAVLTHVGDFNLAGTDEYIEEIISEVDRQLDVFEGGEK